MLVRMVAGRALNRRFCPFVDVTANQTLPVNRFFSFPDGSLLELVKIGLETIQVVLFDLSDCSEVRGDDREAFLVCDFGVSLISLNAFVSFFVDGDLKIIFGGANSYRISRNFGNQLSAGQEVQKDLGMTEFVRGCFVKCISDREVAGRTYIIFNKTSLTH